MDKRDKWPTIPDIVDREFLTWLESVGATEITYDWEMLSWVVGNKKFSIVVYRNDLGSSPGVECYTQNG